MRSWKLLTLPVLLAACRERSFHASSQVQQTVPSGFAEWYGALPPGPIPNYELTASVVFHAAGGDLLPDFKAQFAAAGGGSRLQVTTIGGDRGSEDGGATTSWMRDYHPLVIRSQDPLAGGKARFVGYLSVNRTRSQYTGTQTAALNQPNLLSPQLLPIDSAAIGQERDAISFVRMPLVLEGGNVVATGSHTFVTEHVFEQNSTDYHKYLSFVGAPITQTSLENMYRENGFYEPNAIGERFEYRSPEQVRDVLAKYLEVDRASIVAVPTLPGEKTHHADLYIMALAPDEILIPEITQEGIDSLAYEADKPLAHQAREFLDRQAAALADKVRVTRLAMLPPISQQDLHGTRIGVYVSPTNALLANFGPDRRTVFLPHFALPTDERLRSYNQSVEDSWKQFFEGRGWKPVFVEATRAAESFGLVRCLTAQVPFFSERHWKRFAQLKY